MKELLTLARVFDVDSTALFLGSLLRGLGPFEFSGTVFASSCDVIVLGKWGDECGVLAQLLWVPQDDFGAAVVVLNGPLDFNAPTFELADIPDVFQIAREDDHRERTGVEVLAEVEEGYASISFFHVKDRSADALGFTYMLMSVAEGNTCANCQRRLTKE